MTSEEPMDAADLKKETPAKNDAVGKKKTATKRSIESTEEDTDEKENSREKKAALSTLSNETADKLSKKSKTIESTITVTRKEVVKTRRNINHDELNTDGDESDSAGVYSKRFSTSQHVAIVKTTATTTHSSPSSSMRSKKNVSLSDDCIVLD